MSWMDGWRAGGREGGWASRARPIVRRIAWPETVAGSGRVRRIPNTLRCDRVSLLLRFGHAPGTFLLAAGRRPCLKHVCCQAFVVCVMAVSMLVECGSTSSLRGADYPIVNLHVAERTSIAVNTERLFTNSVLQRTMSWRDRQSQTRIEIIVIN